MADHGFNRKLTAILSADVEGYSRLMGEDEYATVSTLTAYRELMTALIKKHRGRVVDSPGDNLLAEFNSVVNSVRCAVETQDELKIRNDVLPENRKMEFRIGVHLGDVIVEGERIYGDGVNMAARIEGLAEGGGISISGTVYDSIENRKECCYLRKIEPLKKLFDARNELSNLMTYMDGKPGAEELISDAMNNPELLKSLAAAPKPSDDADEEEK